MKTDTDTASTVTEGALNMLRDIREGYAWTKSADAHSRHAAIIRDMRANIIPRFDTGMAAIATAAIDHEAALFIA